MSYSQAAEKIELESTPLQEAQLRIAHDSKRHFVFSGNFYFCFVLVVTSCQLVIMLLMWKNQLPLKH